MNIVHVLAGVGTADSANGVENVVYHLSRSQASAGHRVTVLGISDDAPLPIPGVLTDTVRPSRLPLWAPDQLVDRIRCGEPDIVHLHSVFSPPCTMVGLGLQQLGIPYVVTPHGGLHPRSLRRKTSTKSGFLWLFERPYLNGAAAIHALSEAEACDVRRQGIHAPIGVVANGVETPIGADAARSGVIGRRIPAATGKRMFLFLGRLAIEHKGLDLLIDAAQRARHDLRDSMIVLAGPDWRGSKATLRARIHETGLDDLIVLPGAFYGEEKTQLLGSAQVFLQPSRWEGIPIGLLEAMAAGVPSLVTTPTNMGCHVRAHGAGMAVDATVPDIADALSSMAAASPEALAAMGASAASLMRAQFTWPRITGRMDTLYAKGLCGASGAEPSRDVCWSVPHRDTSSRFGLVHRLSATVASKESRLSGREERRL